MMKRLVDLAVIFLFFAGLPAPAFAQVSRSVQLTFAKAGLVVSAGGCSGVLVYGGHSIRSGSPA
jgi:hypothetical protein